MPHVQRWLLLAATLLCSALAAQAASTAVQRPLLLHVKQPNGSGQLDAIDRMAAASGLDIKVQREGQLDAAPHWDVFWGSRVGCLPLLRDGPLGLTQQVSWIPGGSAFFKGWLPHTLKRAYGVDGAFRIQPPTFSLQLAVDRQRLRAAIDKQGGNGSWVMKTMIHCGDGLRVLSTAETLAAIAQAESEKDPKHVLVQPLIDRQMLLDGRPFYIRVNVVVFGSDPVRAYLYRGGSLLVGRTKVDRPDTIPSDFINSLTLHITEITRDPLAWMHEMNATLSEAQMDAVWQQIEASSAAAVAAAVPEMRRDGPGCGAYRPATTSFAYFGIDYVVDADLKTWLIEVNHEPQYVTTLPVDGVPPELYLGQFVPGMLHILSARNRALRAASRAAKARKRAAASGGSSGSGGSSSSMAAPSGPCKWMPLIFEEQAAAAAAGFVDLTPRVYEALPCIEAGPRAPDACPALARIAPGSLPGANTGEDCSTWTPWHNFRLSAADQAVLSRTCAAADGTG